MRIDRRLLAGAFAFAAGCASTPAPLPVAPMSLPAAEKKAALTVSLTPTVVPTPSFVFEEDLPIDLPTVLRLVDANNPNINLARARVAEAQAKLDKAELQWLPHLSIGTIYNHFDGQTQNQRGEVFGTSRGNLFSGSGVALGVDFAEAIYRPLVERQRKAAEDSRLAASTIGSELEAVTAYFDLVQAHAAIAINADTLAKAEAMLAAAKNAQAAKLDRTAGDVQRAEIEVLQRQHEQYEVRGKAASASAQLGRHLLLPPGVRLIPAETAIAPITLIDPNQSLESLISIGLQNHPQLAANRAAISAAWEQLTLSKKSVVLPKLALVDQIGSFGGGLNNDLQSFDARNVFGVQLAWELRNFGFGNRADIAQQRAVVDQSNYQFLDTQARLIAEIVDAAQTAKARASSMEVVGRRLQEAPELYRIAKEGTINVIDAKNLFDALRPLQAIQTLNQAQTLHVATVMDYNRAQFRLFAALGNAPSCSKNP